MTKSNSLLSNIYFPIILAGFGYISNVEWHSSLFKGIEFLGTILFYIQCIQLIKRQIKLKNVDKLILGYVSLVSLLLLTSIKFNTKDLYTLFFNPLAFSGFFIGIVSLYNDPNAFKVLFKISRFINTYFLGIYLFDLIVFEYPNCVFEFSTFILFELLFFSELTFNRKFYLTALSFFIIFLAKTEDERTLILRFLGEGILLLSFGNIKSLRSRSLKTLMCCITICLLYILFFYFDDVFSFASGIVSQNSSISTNNTRSFIFIEFFQDFKGNEWFTGRGYLGTYFSPYFYYDKSGFGDSANRFSVEIGIFDFILKGGLLLLILFLSILIRSFIKGLIQKPYNSVSFRCSLFLLVQFILLAIENVPIFSINYMFIWASIGFILGKSANEDNLLNFNFRK